MSLENYLNNFQDMFIDRQLNIDWLDTNIVEEEFNLLSKEIESLKLLIDSQNNLTLSGITEFEETYKALITSLTNKIRYIQSVADVLNNLNITYDKNALVDFKVISFSNDVPYDNVNNYYTLKSTPMSNNASFNILTDNSIVIYNQNSSFHNTIEIKSSDFEYIEHLRFTILNVDGTIVDSTYQITDQKILKFSHITTNSLNIICNVTYKDENLSSVLKQQILNSLKISLLLNNYTTYNSYVCTKTLLNKADLYSINQVVNLPPKTYLNYNITIDDITFTIPIGNTLVCKRLDDVNFNEVKKLVGMYIKEFYTTENLTKEYLENLDQKTEKYIIYETNLTKSVVINNKLKLHDNYSFSYKTIKDQLALNLSVEMYTFNKNVTPSIKNITGFSKNE